MNWLNELAYQALNATNNPGAFILAIIIFMSVFFIPMTINLLWWHHSRKLYRTIKSSQPADLNRRFWHNLDVIYSHWIKDDSKGAHTKIVNELVEKAQFPPWLPIKRNQPLNPIAKSEIGKAVGESEELWRFIGKVYDWMKEIRYERTAKGQRGLNIRHTKEEIGEHLEEFDKARKELADYWNEVAEDFPFFLIKNEVKDNVRLFKVLVYCEVSLHIQDIQFGGGRGKLHRLCKRAAKEETRLRKQELKWHEANT